MLTPDAIREELIRQLVSGEVIAANVAARLRIAPARVTEMKKRDRRVQPEEMQDLAEMLGMVPGSPANKIKTVETTDEIQFEGRVAQGVWLEQSMAEPNPEDVQRVPYDRMRGDPASTDLFAVEPEGTSMNLAFPLPNMRLICRRVPFGTGDFKSGDLAIIERTAHDLREMTCKRVRIDEEGVFWLDCESSDPKFAGVSWRVGKPSESHHNDIEVTFLGKVIRSVVNYE